jgi:UDP-4-amino-4,6-dideoxy-N-acetyl-beta-L-altrosamine N-acetyltransferase
MAVRDIRNQLSVRVSMYNEHLISENEHLSWIDALKGNGNHIVYAVLNEMQKPVGVVSLNAIDRLHKKSDWAFYLDESERGGLGAAIEYFIIDYAFEALELMKLNCEVIETNIGVVRMHKKFHFREEGFRRSNIEKNAKRIGVYLLGLTAEDWVEARESVHNKYASIFSKFSISLDEDAGQHAHPI